MTMTPLLPTPLEGACWRVLARRSLGTSAGRGEVRFPGHGRDRAVGLVWDDRDAAGAVSVAREDRAGYATTQHREEGVSGVPTAPSAGHTAGQAHQVPPVAYEVAGLAEALDALLTADAAMLAAVTHLRRLLSTGEVEAATGLGVEEWVAYVTRHTQMDRRTLLAAVRLCDRFPSLGDAVSEGRVSWPQLRKLTMTLRRAPVVLDDRLDVFLSDAIDTLAGVEADALVRQVEGAVREWTGQLTDPDDPPPAPFLHLQPRLDGTGGKVAGELDAAGLALLDAATAPTRAQLDHPGGVGGARADNLLGRLAASQRAPEGTASDPHDTTHDGDGDRHADDGAGGRAAVDGAGAGAGGELPRVKLLLRVTLDSLLDRTATPAEVLTTLLGGRLRLTSAAARRLVDERGADLRAVVVDDAGSVLGVGRTSRVAPGWLRDVIAAVHDTCTEPCCERSARICELDHAIPWQPTAPDRPYGTTDVGNIGPLCGRPNRGKEAAGWQATQTVAGRRSWHHPRSGITIDTIPSTWRPPGYQPAIADRTHDPGGPDPGGPDPGGPDPGDDPDQATIRAPDPATGQLDVRAVLGLPVAPSRAPDPDQDVPF